MKKRCVRMPNRSSAVSRSRVSGACIASYSRATDREALRNAGCAVTSSTRSPSIHTSRPSRRLSRYSSPVSIRLQLLRSSLSDLAAGGLDRLAVRQLGALGVLADHPPGRVEVGRLEGLDPLLVVAQQPRARLVRG